MAKVGLKYPVYAPLTEGESTVSYAGGKELAKAIAANITIETNDVELAANDAIAESDHSFSSGSISMDIDDLPDFAKVDLLGYAEGSVVDVTLGTKELTAGRTSEPGNFGFGFFGRKVKNNVSYWRAIWLRKVKFAEPSDENATQGKTIEFRTPTIEGTIMIDATGNWKDEATFSTEALAKAWLDGKAGLVAKAANVTSNVASGTYTDAQSVTLSTTEATGDIYYTTDGTIPSATNGTEYTTAIACADPSNTCIKAVCVAPLKANSDILELYITVTA
jgi:phi13 family phage major tail protein